MTMPIPEHFTTDFYQFQKTLKKTDNEIAHDLFISVSLLSIWKRKIGWTGKQLKCGRKPAAKPEEVKELRSKGMTQAQIADSLGISEPTVRKYLKLS